jgi:hypothetical protein
MVDNGRRDDVEEARNTDRGIVRAKYRIENILSVIGRAREEELQKK